MGARQRARGDAEVNADDKRAKLMNAQRSMSKARAHLLAVKREADKATAKAVEATWDQSQVALRFREIGEETDELLVLAKMALEECAGEIKDTK